MDHSRGSTYPGGSISATPQQAPTSRASIQGMLSLDYPQPADAVGAQFASADGQSHPSAHESGYFNEGGAQLPAESSPRRRNINSSKRAAQNRAAQRAFRLRRERYVAGLEEKARSYDRIEAAYLEVQRENYYLRARLARTHSENIALRAHVAASGSPPPLPSPTPALMPTSPMAAAVAGANPMAQFLAVSPASLAEPGIYCHYHGPDHRQPHPKQAPPLHAPRRHLQNHQPHAVGYAGTTHPAEAMHAQALQHHARPFPRPPLEAFGLSLSLTRPGSSTAIPCQPQQQQQQPQWHFKHHQEPPPLGGLGPGPLVHNPLLSTAPPDELWVDCEHTPKAGAAAAGPTLPSVREITMSISAVPQAGPYAERGPSPPRARLLDECSGSRDSSQGGECTESRMRPW